MGHGDLGPPGRGRQRLQRQLARRASAVLALRRGLGRCLRSLPPLRGRHRARGRARARRLPLLARVVAHRARGGRVLDGGARPLPARAGLVPRARPDADAHVPPLHLAALDRDGRRLGECADGRPLRPLLRALDASPRRSRPVCLHAQRAEPRQRCCTACWAFPSRRRRRRIGSSCSRTRTARAPPRSCARRTGGGRGDQGRARGDERRVDGRDDRVGGRAGRRGDDGAAARHHRGRVSRGPRGRLHRRPELHGHARRARRARSSPARTPSARRWAISSSPRRSVTRSGERPR